MRLIDVLNNCLTTKFLASVLTVKDRLWRRFLRLYRLYVLSGSSCLSTWCPLVSRLLKRLSSLLSISCVVVFVVSPVQSESHSSSNKRLDALFVCRRRTTRLVMRTEAWRRWLLCRRAVTLRRSCRDSLELLVHTETASTLRWHHGRVRWLVGD